MDDQVKKMGQLLRSGATMLQETCPTCNSPLFKFEGKVLCVNCGPQSPRRAEPVKSVDLDAMVLKMMSTILIKLDKLNDEVSKTTDFNNLYLLGKVTLTFLRTLEYLRRLKVK